MIQHFYTCSSKTVWPIESLVVKSCETVFRVFHGLHTCTCFRLRYTILEDANTFRHMDHIVTHFLIFVFLFTFADLQYLSTRLSLIVFKPALPPELWPCSMGSVHSVTEGWPEGMRLHWRYSYIALWIW